MLLIIFYGEFGIFYMSVMPILKSKLNHGEFKLKSKLQIKIWKKRSSVEKKLSNPSYFARVAKFFNPCKIVDPTKFCRAANFCRAMNFRSLRIWLLLTFFVLFLISSKIVPK